MQEEIFINCVAEDLPYTEEIKKRLEIAGLSYNVQTAQLNPALQEEMVERIKSIAAAHGCMVCILSQKAISNSLFISNIQLMCETARNNRVLIYYQVEQLENDQNVRLFASQAYQVKKTGRASEDVSGIIKRINQIIHPPTRNIITLLSGIISKKTLTWLLIAVVMLGVIASVFVNYSQKTPSAPVQPTSTPALIYTPFSGQSQNRGLTEDVRFVPDYQPAGDPGVEAPFYFKPGAVFEQEDINDPTYEHTYDEQKWSFSNILNDVSSMAVTQTNGVLQMAVAPISDNSLSLVLGSKYSFNLQQVTYLGYRFRLNDYQGTIQENTSFHGHFFYQMDGPQAYIDATEFDGLSQDLLNGSSGIQLGSNWHTVEMISQKDRHFVDVYLDGKKINTLSFDDEQLNRWMHFTFALDISNTTDWVRIQINNIVFGGDQPFSQKLQPQEASYRFIPDTVDVHEDFITQANQLALRDGAEFVTQSNGLFSFRIPAGKDNPVIRFDLPTKTLNVDNDYATRFRFTSPHDNYWANYAYFFLGIENKNLSPGNGYEIGTFRSGNDFQGHFGTNQAIDDIAYDPNAQPGSWHTLEMIFKPPDESSQAYTVFYWVDGYLMGMASLPDSVQYLDANAPLVGYIQISGGSDRQNVFSGEINDLVIGTIASDKIKE